MPGYGRMLKQRFNSWKIRRRKAFNLFLRNLDMFLYYQVHKFDKVTRERRRKRRKESFRRFMIFVKAYFLFQARKLSKDVRQLRKRRRQERYKMFLKNLDFRLFRIIDYFGKEAKAGRKKRRQASRKMMAFRIKSFWERIKYYNKPEMRKQRRARRKKAFNFMIKNIVFFFNLYILKVYNEIVGLRYWLRNKENRRSFFVNAVNSSAIFLLAYFTMFFIYQICTMLLAHYYSISSRMLYFKTDFLVHSSSNLWTRKIVIEVCFIGPLVCLILGFALLRLFHILKKRKGLFRLFILWCSIHGVNMFFGAYVGGVFSNKGFGLVFLWFFFQLFLNIALAFVSVILLIFIGTLYSKAFLQTAHDSNLISKANKPYFLLSQVLMPYIIGNLFIDFAIEFPGGLNFNKVYQIVMIACIGFMIFPMLSKPYEETVRLAKDKGKLKVNALLIFIFIVVAIAFRYGLAIGLKFRN